MNLRSKPNPVQLSLESVQNTQSQIRAFLHAQMRGAALRLVHDLFRQEVLELSGESFSRKGDEMAHRIGSDPGSVKLEGQRVAVKKPRVKKNGKELELQSYSALQGFDLLSDRVMKQMIAGTSTRDYEGLLTELEGGLGLKRSTVSKAFVQGSKQALDEINGRDLSVYRFFSMMIDGIEFGGKLVIVALGITTQGKKLILGLKEGDTENSEVCKDLLQNLIERGLRTDEPMLFVLDGSKALKKAVRKVFGEDAPIQRCIRHKERNCLSYLPEEHHAEFRRRWRMIHGMVRYDEAKQEYLRLSHFLKRVSIEAHNSLEEAELETLTIIKLNTPDLLRKTLSSTNAIESVFSRVRSRSIRVKNWKSGPNQITRWSATLLLAAEKKFRLIRGYREIPLLLNELKRNPLLETQEVA